MEETCSDFKRFESLREELEPFDVQQFLQVLFQEGHTDMTRAFWKCIEHIGDFALDLHTVNVKEFVNESTAFQYLVVLYLKNSDHLRLFNKTEEKCLKLVEKLDLLFQDVSRMVIQNNTHTEEFAKCIGNYAEALKKFMRKFELFRKMRSQLAMNNYQHLLKAHMTLRRTHFVCPPCMLNHHILEERRRLRFYGSFYGQFDIGAVLELVFFVTMNECVDETPLYTINFSQFPGWFASPEIEIFLPEASKDKLPFDICDMANDKHRQTAFDIMTDKTGECWVRRDLLAKCNSDVFGCNYDYFMSQVREGICANKGMVVKYLDMMGQFLNEYFSPINIPDLLAKVDRIEVCRESMISILQQIACCMSNDCHFSPDPTDGNRLLWIVRDFPAENCYPYFCTSLLTLWDLMRESISDVLGRQRQALRVLIQPHYIAFEQTKFLAVYSSTPKTGAWMERSNNDVTKAFVSVISGKYTMNPETCPETLQLFAIQLRDIHLCFVKVSYMIAMVKQDKNLTGTIEKRMKEDKLLYTGELGTPDSANLQSAIDQLETLWENMLLGKPLQTQDSFWTLVAETIKETVLHSNKLLTLYFNVYHPIVQGKAVQSSQNPDELYLNLAKQALASAEKKSNSVTYSKSFYEDVADTVTISDYSEIYMQIQDILDAA